MNSHIHHSEGILLLYLQSEDTHSCGPGRAVEVLIGAMISAIYFVRKYQTGSLIGKQRMKALIGGRAVGWFLLAAPVVQQFLGDNPILPPNESHKFWTST